MTKLTAKNAASARIVEIDVPKGSITVAEVIAKIADIEIAQPNLVTLIYKGSILKDKFQMLSLSEMNQQFVYLMRKGGTHLKTSTKKVIPPVPAPGTQTSSDSNKPEPKYDGTRGKRVVLLIRHGQCCNMGEPDERKGLTAHGHLQAGETAAHIKELFERGFLPAKKGLLQSTSRRARETAAKILQAGIPNLQVWNADIIRETDPTKNPRRAEAVFQTLLQTPAAANQEDAVVIVSHNNIILYLLMRAAGVPMEKAAFAWKLFHLRHASVTHLEIDTSGTILIRTIGGAAHQTHPIVTWNNIKGEDLAHLNEMKPVRTKFSGRMLVLLAVDPASDPSAQRAQAMAFHVAGLPAYMVSSKVRMLCTAGSQVSAFCIKSFLPDARGPEILPDSILTDPEGVFTEFFKPPSGRSRDTLILVCESKVMEYWLRRALHMSPEEAAKEGNLAVTPESLALVNIKSDGSTKVVAVGDTGHLGLNASSEVK